MNATKTKAEEPIRPRRGLTPRKNPTERKFTPEVFDALIKDITEGRIPVGKFVLTDGVQTALRLIIRDTGTATFHAGYKAPDGSMAYIRIGSHPKMTVAEARELSRTIRGLAERGIDVQDGLHDRLIRELKRDGLRWSPDGTKRAETHSAELEAAIAPLVKLGLSRDDAIKTVQAAIKKGSK